MTYRSQTQIAKTESQLSSKQRKLTFSLLLLIVLCWLGALLVPSLRNSFNEVAIVSIASILGAPLFSCLIGLWSIRRPASELVGEAFFLLNGRPVRSTGRVISENFHGATTETTTYYETDVSSRNATRSDAFRFLSATITNACGKACVGFWKLAAIVCVPVYIAWGIYKVAGHANGFDSVAAVGFFFIFLGFVAFVSLLPVMFLHWLLFRFRTTNAQYPVVLTCDFHEESVWEYKRRRTGS